MSINLRGSYRALLGNAIEALSAAVEIYNKPKISYREECSIILLINAWELLLKALLSKKKQRIYYPKERNQPYRTYSLKDALTKAEEFFPESVDYHPTRDNILLLKRYRDTTIHFYNDESLHVPLYALAQTSIVNFRDVVSESFDRDIAEEITLSLLPLSIAPPIDSVEFLRACGGNGMQSRRTREFTQSIRNIVIKSEEAGYDTGRILTAFNVQLVSVKKVSSADFVVGVDGSQVGEGRPVLVHKLRDPNITHPYRESDIITSKANPNKAGLELTIGGAKLTQHTFRAITWKYDIRNQPKYCWMAKNRHLVLYSREYVTFLKRLTEDDVKQAIADYKSWCRSRNHR